MSLSAFHLVYLSDEVIGLVVWDHVMCLQISFQDQHDIRERLEQALGPVMSCFRRIRFISMNLDEAQNQYDKGRFSPSPSTMFHSLFGLEELYAQYSHFLLVEPDVRALRSGWLDRLAMEVVVDRIDFWQKGSIEYSFEQGDGHINGNAIYRLGNMEYNCFLEAALAIRYPDSFDQGQYFVMHQPDRLENAHRFGIIHFVLLPRDSYPLRKKRVPKEDTFLCLIACCCRPDPCTLLSLVMSNMVSARALRRTTPTCS